MNLPYLLAQNEGSWLAPSDFAIWFSELPRWASIPLVLLWVFVIPFVIGWAWAKWLRMPNYGWRIGLILCTIAAGLATIALGWPPKLGVDLKGGYIMIFQIEQPEDTPVQERVGADANIREETSSRSALITQLKKRLNPDGLKEISIRPYGLSEVEIIVPETDEAEINKLKRQVQEQGVLKFLILAEQNSDRQLFELAREQNQDPLLRRQADVKDKNGETLARWVKVGREEKERSGVSPLRIAIPWDVLLVRRTDTLEILDSTRIPTGALSSARYLREQEIPDVEVLMKASKQYEVTGQDLVTGATQTGIDESGFPSVLFSFKPASAAKMGSLTSAHIERQLAIVLDDALLSHATIQSQITDSGRITGRFTRDEVDFVIRILKAGSLDAKLKKEPVYEDRSDPTLGAENIRQGAWAIVISLAMVFVFCLAYYRFAGIVASLALAMNILLTLAVMILFGATLTMPGLAGLVLTVGMAVDANVLIFERMREELDKGSSLRMAIRNGYDRAMSTIIDSNLTTLLTAIILYIIGTDQLVGFAVTLTLGLLISMFTAIFVTRVIFEIGERTGWIRTLRFNHIFSNVKVDFVRYMNYSVAVSVVLIAIGLAAAFWRGNGIFDIDLRGGSSVQVSLNTPLTMEEMRTYVDQALVGIDYKGSKVDATIKPVGAPTEGEKHDSFRIDTIIPNTNEVQNLLAQHLQENGQSLLKNYRMSFDAPGASGAGDESKFFDPAPGAEAAEGAAEGAMVRPADERLFVAFQAEEEKDAAPKAETKSEPEPKADAKSDEKKEDTSDDAPKTPADQGDDSGAAPKTDASGEKPAAGDADLPVAVPTDAQRVTSTVRFTDNDGEEESLDPTEVQARVERAAEAVGLKGIQVVVDHPEWDRDSASRRSEWNVTMTASPEEATKILQRMQTSIGSEPVWAASKKIGGQIAGDFVRIAIGALVASLLGIILYIWFRFQNVTWGFAAVVALIHDVLFMLAGIAVSYFIVQAIPDGTLGLTEFKIDLTVIAAFLTLIGFSINDTIVIFDRMRELKGKLPNINRQIVNDSINQTLSRSFLTFLTVFMVVVVLYIWGGPGIHAFAYAMLIGTFVGMYSTVFIAAPFLLWMLDRQTAKKPA